MNADAVRKVAAEIRDWFYSPTGVSYEMGQRWATTLDAACKDNVCVWEKRGDIYFAPCGHWSMEKVIELRCPCVVCGRGLPIKVKP